MGEVLVAKRGSEIESMISTYDAAFIVQGRASRKSGSAVTDLQDVGR
tara:strand:+ start:18136 stop:18276 length:141 start_codon:yes stop_codon:yes gene_type:complete